MIKIKTDFHTVKGYEMINSTKNLLTPSMEDYVEMIYRCSLENTYIRVNSIAQNLNVKDSSVSKMMKKLAEISLVEYEKYGLIKLTDLGKDLGLFLYKRHKTIEEFLSNINSNDDNLTETELIEHVLTIDTVNNIQYLNDFFNDNPEILNKYRNYKSKFK